MEIGHDYANHNTGSMFYKKEGEDLDAINKYLRYLNQESENPNSNLLLSKYVHQITEGNAFIGEDVEKTDYGYKSEEQHNVYIGKNKYLNMLGLEYDSEHISWSDSPENLIIGKHNYLKDNDFSITGDKKRAVENRKIFILLWKNKHLRESLEKEFNIQFSDLSLNEQIQVANQLKSLRNKDSEKINKFSHKYGLTGFRTFLSLEHGGKEMGDKIMTLGERLPKNITEKVFKKYSEIIDQTYTTAAVLEERFAQKGSPQLISTINDSLLKKAKDLLLESAKNLDKCKDENCEEVGAEIENRLTNIHEENIALASIFKALAQNEIISNVSEVLGMSVDIVKSKDEIKQYQDEIVRIFTENRADYPPELLKETVEEFEQTLNSMQNTEFYILKNNDEIMSFMGFDKLKNGNLYWRSFNSRNEIQGLAVGGIFAKELLDEKSKDHNIEAVAFEKNKMLPRYLGEFKFQLAGEIENYKKSGEKFVKLFRSITDKTTPDSQS